MQLGFLARSDLDDKRRPGAPCLQRLQHPLASGLSRPRRRCPGRESEQFRVD